MIEEYLYKTMLRKQKKKKKKRKKEKSPQFVKFQEKLVCVIKW